MSDGSTGTILRQPRTSREDRYPSRVKPEPVWLDRKDPVVHSDWTPDSPLTREQHDSFATNGFLVLKGLFSADEVAAMQAEHARLLERPQRLLQDSLIRERGSDAIRSIFAIHRQSALYEKLCSDERLANVARHLLGDEVYIHQSRLNYKPGFRGKEFYWHSDFETWHVEDGMPAMRAVSVSVQLSDNTPSNGPLMLIPGSHRHYVTCVGETPEDHYRASLRKQEYGVPDDDSLARLVDTGGLVAPTGPAGDVVIFDCNTMHGSNGNITPHPRANAFFVYNAVSNAIEAPFGADKGRPEFVASRRRMRPVRPRRGGLTERRRRADA